MKKFMVLALLTTAVTLSLPYKGECIERVVILAPAAADVLAQLGADESVVGVTNSVMEFPHAAKVGTHLNPGIEKVASLQPTLIIANSRFNPELAKRMGAECFVYEPRTLEGIIDAVRVLAQKIEKREAGEELASTLEDILNSLQRPENPPTVLYETRSTPVAIAKKQSIIKNTLEQAGMMYAYPQSTGMISAEYLLAHQPDFYIYQEGPMNKNPVSPLERVGWGGLRSCIWKVDEFDFARANTQLFTTVQELNTILNTDTPCETGKKRYPQ